MMMVNSLIGGGLYSSIGLFYDRFGSYSGAFLMGIILYVAAGAMGMISVNRGKKKGNAESVIDPAHDQAAERTAKTHDHSGHRTEVYRLVQLHCRKGRDISLYTAAIGSSMYMVQCPLLAGSIVGDRQYSEIWALMMMVKYARSPGKIEQRQFEGFLLRQSTDSLPASRHHLSAVS